MVRTRNSGNALGGPALATVALAVTMLAFCDPAHAGPAGGETGRLDRTVVPTFQSVRLTLDPSQADYRGDVHMDLAVAVATDSFRLHARELEIISVVLRGPAGEIPVRYESGANSVLTVRASVPLAPGPYGLDIAFANRFDTRANGLYRLETGGDWYCYTQFEADAAREAFPCWDEPGFKIPWQLTLTVPAAASAVSNTPVEGAAARGNVKTVTFRKTQPLPSYLVAIAVGPFEYVPIPGMSVPGRVVTTRGASRLAAEAVRITPPLLAALEQYFERRYPYEKLDLLAVPEFAAGAMENAGAITFRDELLLVDPATASARQRSRLIATTAHELAHMWFGDLVTLAWWDDIWLNESFASWMGDKVAAGYAPQYRYEIQSLRGRQNAMRTDARPSTRAIRQPVGADDNFDRLFDELSYDKGHAVLTMLESWIGEDTFRKGVLRYIGKHAGGSATGADLWRALSEASGRDIAATTASFLEQPGVPLVTVEPLAGGRLRLIQRRFRHAASAPSESLLWKIPVNLRWSDGRQTHARSVLLESAEQTIALEPAETPRWIHANAGERGYYRWSAPAAMLERIAEQPGALDVRERVGLLGTLDALVEGGVVGGDTWVRVLARFAGDESPEVVGAVVEGWEKIRRVLVSGAMEGSFLLATRRLLRPALDRFGLRPARGEPDAVKLMRPGLLAALAVHGNDDEVQAWADASARTYLADPARVDGTVAGAALNLAARRGDDSLFARYRRRFETTKIPAERARLLTALGHFRAPERIERALDYTLAGPLRPQELMVIPREIAGESDMHADHVWTWYRRLAHERVAPRIPPWFVPFLPHIAACCLEHRIEEARAFFGLTVAMPPGTGEELAKLADGIRDCAELRRRESAAVARALAQIAGSRPAPASAPGGAAESGGRP
jgi:alanyl aminopeptidase